MNKIICDICGTSYPDTADQCPICGYSRALDQFLLEKTQPVGQESERVRSAPAVKGGRFSSANVRRREQEETYPPLREEEDYDNEYAPQPRRANPVLVTLLVVVILAMLTVTGFLFLRFFLPNVGQEETTPSASQETTEEPTRESIEETTEEPTIPCESLELISEPEVVLSGIGQYYLIHVEFAPADTTDTLAYTSSDETVATVDDEGRVEVTGEGTATITVTCGGRFVECVVTCVPEDQDPTDETVEETTEETTGETTPETTEETTGSTIQVELYLDKSDFTLGFRGDFYQLKFNPELKAEDITWISGNPNVATVENGKVTAISYGTTRITAKYGDQEVSCVVRCVW